MRKARFISLCCGSVLYAVLFLSCGLPTAVSIPTPTLATLDPKTHPAKTTLGFNPSAKATEYHITGYKIYYKIYKSDADFESQGDEKFFDETSAYYTGSTRRELQPGDSVPVARKFSLAGNLALDEKNPNKSFTVSSESITTSAVYIDFNPTSAGTVESYGEPVVKTNDKVIATLRRGYVDRRVTNGKLLSFVKDWEYSNQKTKYTDGDLLRPPARQPGDDSSDFSSGSKLLFEENPLNQIQIAFVIIASGMDVSNLTPVSSKPLWLGKIEYSYQIYPANRN